MTRIKKHICRKAISIRAAYSLSSYTCTHKPNRRNNWHRKQRSHNRRGKRSRPSYCRRGASNQKIHINHSFKLQTACTSNCGKHRGCGHPKPRPHPYHPPICPPPPRPTPDPDPTPIGRPHKAKEMEACGNIMIEANQDKIELWRSDQKIVQRLIQIAVFNSSSSNGDLVLEIGGSSIVRMMIQPGNTATYLGRSIQSIHVFSEQGNAGPIEGKYSMSSIVNL